MSGLSEAVLSQIHLSGEVDCPHFKPHMLKANLCVECSKLISKHSPAAIPDDDCLLRVNKYIIRITTRPLMCTGYRVLPEG